MLTEAARLVLQSLTRGRAPCPPALVGMQSLRTAVAPRSPCSGVQHQLALMLVQMMLRQRGRLHSIHTFTWSVPVMCLPPEGHIASPLLLHHAIYLNAEHHLFLSAPPVTNHRLRAKGCCQQAAAPKSASAPPPPFCAQPPGCSFSPGWAAACRLHRPNIIPLRLQIG